MAAPSKRNREAGAWWLVSPAAGVILVALATLTIALYGLIVALLSGVLI